jgi:hypothetical protein
VDQTMMAAAEEAQVPERRFASVCPVLDVMAVDVDAVRATREAAAAVPKSERAANRRRNRTGAPADVERGTGRILHDRVMRAIAG